MAKGLRSDQRLFWAEPYNTNRETFFLWFGGSVIGRIYHRENDDIEVSIHKGQILTENDFRDLATLVKVVKVLFDRLHVRDVK